jgi:hypothetical protein
LYTYKNNCKKNLWEKRQERKREKPEQIGANVTALVFNAGLLARRSCDRPTRSSFSMVFHGSTANAELVPKFHVAFPTVTLKISPYTNVTLGWITLFIGDMGEGALHEEKRK